MKRLGGWWRLWIAGSTGDSLSRAVRIREMFDAGSTVPEIKTELQRMDAESLAVLHEQLRHWHRKDLIVDVLSVFIGPIVFLLAGFSVRWVWRGFRPAGAT